jgi:hypothetical protein
MSLIVHCVIGSQKERRIAIIGDSGVFQMFDMSGKKVCSLHVCRLISLWTTPVQMQQTRSAHMSLCVVVVVVVVVVVCCVCCCIYMCV